MTRNQRHVAPSHDMEIHRVKRRHYQNAGKQTMNFEFRVEHAGDCPRKPPQKPAAVARKGSMPRASNTAAIARPTGGASAVMSAKRKIRKLIKLRAPKKKESVRIERRSKGSFYLLRAHREGPIQQVPRQTGSRRRRLSLGYHSIDAAGSEARPIRTARRRSL